jgi:hypothetical protein
VKLIDTAHYEDYGHEWYFQLLQCYPNFALLDVSIQWDEFPATELFPMLLISFGSRSLTGFSFRWKWFEIRCDFLTTVPRNLASYRRYKSGDYRPGS